MDIRGFIDFIKDLIDQRGHREVERLLRNWGYDEDFYPTVSRTFVLTMHSASAIKVSIEDTTKSDSASRHNDDLEETVNKLIIQKFGEVAEQKPGVYSLMHKHHE